MNNTLENHVRAIIDGLDKDPTREGLVETPKRYIKFLEEFLNPPDFKYTTFDGEGYDQMIVQLDIPFYSFCEHHIAPFFGKAHVAYIPDGRIVGISKLARTVELYSRRLQNQERITKQIADRLTEELKPKGVAVILEAEHMCMAMRGVKKSGALTKTSIMTGVFKQAETRNEFLMMIK